VRFNVVDEFDRDGQRFVLVRRSLDCTTGFAALTEREREIAALAGAGLSNKYIAYELGLADSTVRVLMARACAKLDAATRRELVARVLAEGLVPGPDQGPSDQRTTSATIRTSASTRTPA
jgi:DNA-binding NarL/FixJ family response regulator